MLPSRTARIGCYTYSIEIHDASVSDNQGDTCLDKKRINLFYNGNKEVLRETLQHEILHALCEDIFKTIKEIEDVQDKEEQFIRLFSPRLMAFNQDNPEIADFIWGEENE